MILDRIENAGQYEALLPDLMTALQAAAEQSAEPYHPGRVDLDGDRLYLNVCAYETKRLETAPLFEAHRKFADIMYMAEGEETVCITPTEALRTPAAEYDPQKDALLAYADGSFTSVQLCKGQFLVLFPQDAHCPGCCTDEPHPVRKIICKLAL